MQKKLKQKTNVKQDGHYIWNFQSESIVLVCLFFNAYNVVQIVFYAICKLSQKYAANETSFQCLFI